MEGEQEEEQEQETGEELAMAAMDISSSPSSINNSPTRKVAISVEVCLKPTSTARHHDVLFAVERLLEKRSLTYKDGPVSVSESDDPFLFENIESIYICDTDNNAYTYLDELTENTILLFWQVTLEVHVFQLNEEGPGEEIEGSDEIASFQEWVLPAREFHGLWDSLMYGKGLKQQLLRYADTALLFAEKGVAPHLISWNRVILFHGPPGTGKTSLCKALAQKLSIRLCKRYSQAQLVEVNAHSLFSKWFSESGKLVTRLFSKIQEFVDEEGSFTFVLIDEVESLAAARQAALSGSEPSDSIRVVNALLTQLDRLKSCPNVMILATSNITGAIDIAFIDRADLKLYIGPPTIEVRYEILHSCLSELCRVGILRKTLEYKFPSYAELQRWVSTSNDANQLPHHISNSLLMAAKASEGLSGRVLRKLPFLAYTLLPNKGCVDLSTFLEMVLEAIKGEQAERLRMNGESK